MPTNEPQAAAADILRNTRNARTMRDFAADLGVSHAAIDQWEHGAFTFDGERLLAWIRDERQWIRHLGLELFAVRYPSVIESLLTRVSVTA